MSVRSGYGVILAGVSLLLMGCAVSDRPAIDRPPLTLPAPPTALYQGSCAETLLLEQWMQPVTFQQREFAELLMTVGDQSPVDLYPQVERMAQLRDRISGLTVPDCAVPTQEAFVTVMSAVIAELQAYVNGEERDPAAITAEHQPAFADAQAMLNALYLDLTGESLFPTAAP